MKRVAVGLSGGVDSAVAAALLAREGYDVVGVTMKIWDGRPLPAASRRHGCYGPGEPEDIADAERIAAALAIPFHVVDLAAEYTAEVLDPAFEAYRAGMTPNPCVHCNRLIKFGRIPARLRSCGVAVDLFATGHYARIERDAARGRHLLMRGKDRDKDQSYFLYLLTQEQLATTLFPLGDRSKVEVRRLAAEFGLPVAEKPESQDFAAGGFRALFADEERPGPILDATGEVIGEHPGVHFYTVGQRRGLGIARGEPLYVIEIDPRRNAIIVGEAAELASASLVAGRCNWIAIERLAEPLRVEARLRYQHRGIGALIAPVDGERVSVTFDSPQRAVTPGQAVVFYDGDTVVGGGTIVRPTSG